MATTIGWMPTSPRCAKMAKFMVTSRCGPKPNPTWSNALKPFMHVSIKARPPTLLLKNTGVFMATAWQSLLSAGFCYSSPAACWAPYQPPTLLSAWLWPLLWVEPRKWCNRGALPRHCKRRALPLTTLLPPIFTPAAAMPWVKLNWHSTPLNRACARLLAALRNPRKSFNTRREQRTITPAKPMKAWPRNNVKRQVLPPPCSRWRKRYRKWRAAPTKLLSPQAPPLVKWKKAIRWLRARAWRLMIYQKQWVISAMS